ncbi:DUF397 domain-containing protein [Pseudonocardia spinosispora]|uniref:DUF397 domain-containing protein n=1 Tax=Pseudonocardia spinosispora TaxID=103441 RepID=UPI0003F63A45|nr:DUF397 domain-containing protein [Pseudonocardia spinosispora]
MAEPRWRTSSYSTHNGECVEVAALGDDIVGIRDTKNRAAGTLVVTQAAMSALIVSLRGSEVATLVD